MKFAKDGDRDQAALSLVLDLQDMIGAGFAARRLQLQKPAAGPMPQLQ
jgi:hypothetical protein